MGKEAASRSLNYNLPQHILDRVARTSGTERNEMASAINVAGQGLAKDLEAQELTRRAEVKLEKEKEDLKREIGLESYNNGMDYAGNRGDAPSPSAWDAKMAIEKAKREDFINADPSEHADLLRDQAARSASHTRNRESTDLVVQARGNEDLDEDSMSAEQLHMIGMITGEETEIVLNEHNEYEWRYRPIGWVEGDELATATSKDVEKIMEEHMLPKTEQVEFQKALAGVASASENKPDNPYNSTVVYNTAKDMIKSKNIKQMLTNGDVWGSQGDSFADHFLDWTGFDNMELDLRYEPGGEMQELDPNHDGVFTKEELSRADREAVIGLLGKEENYDLAKELLLDYAVERGRLQHQGMVDVANKKNRELEKKKGGGIKGKGGITSLPKNKNSEILGKGNGWYSNDTLMNIASSIAKHETIPLNDYTFSWDEEKEAYVTQDGQVINNKSALFSTILEGSVDDVFKQGSFWKSIPDWDGSSNSGPAAVSEKQEKEIKAMWAKDLWESDAQTRLSTILDTFPDIESEMSDANILDGGQFQWKGVTYDLGTQSDADKFIKALNGSSTSGTYDNI
jgi:hypothetical protein